MVAVADGEGIFLLRFGGRISEKSPDWSDFRLDMREIGRHLYSRVDDLKFSRRARATKRTVNGMESFVCHGREWMKLSGFDIGEP